MDKQNLAQPVSGGQEAKSISPPSHPDTFKYLDFIFDGIKGHYVEFFYLKAGKKGKPEGPPDFLQLPLDREAVESLVLRHNGRQGIAVGVAPRFTKPATRYEAGKNCDVLEVTCIWSDIDFKSVRGGAIEVCQRIKALPLRPSLVVDSGYGRHVYYACSRVLRGNDLIEWAVMIRKLRDVLQSDSTIDISRRLRLPGTYNVKEETPELCHICEEDSSWARYSLDEIRHALQSVPEDQHLRTTRRIGRTPALLSEDSPSTAELRAVWTREALRKRGVYKQVVEAIVTGEWTVKTGKNAGRNDDRHSRDCMIANTLLELNFTEDEVEQIFHAYPEGCGSKVADPQHGRHYLDMTIEAAVSNQKKKGNRIATADAPNENRYAGSHGNGRHPVHGSQPHEDAEQRADVDSFDDRGLPTGAEDALPENYQFHDNGSIWYHPPTTAWDKTVPKPQFVCETFMRIVEIQKNVDTGELSLVIEFRYGDAVEKTTILRPQMLESRSIVAVLGRSGAPVDSNNARKVIGYLRAYENTFLDTIPRKKVTNRFGRGRAEGPFFLPGMASDIEFAPVGAGDMSLYRAFASRKGTVGDWVQTMNLVTGDSMMIPQAAICASFIPPLQGKLQIPNFILDINGTTGSGKSITAKLAASVWGKPREPDSVILQWEATKVAIEQVVNLCSELPFFLDDAQHVSDDLKRTVIYMIANGKGKARGSKAGGIRETPYWHTVAISTSEHPLHESSPHEGARARLLPVGGIEVRPFPRGMKNFVDGLDRAITANHGVAGEMFIRHIGGWTETQWYAWYQRYTTVRRVLGERATSDIVSRVSDYIAAIQLAGEIVRQLFGLRFDPERISRWLMNHLEDQQKAQDHVALALQALADFYVSNRRSFYGSDPYAILVNPPLLIGAVRQNEFVGFLATTVNDVFSKRKWNTTAILNKFAAEKVLHKPDAGHHTRKVGVDGEKPRLVCVKWEALFPAGLEDEELDVVQSLPHAREIDSGEAGF
jgi:hypothetical protein